MTVRVSGFREARKFHNVFSRSNALSSILVLTALGVMGFTSTAAAEEAGVTRLETIDVNSTGVSNMDSASSGDVGHDEIVSRPILRPGAILETVPGLIVTQHSGEGKANQYFMRAFNLDHGTDLATVVDNMPINFPAHAHGQGYTDLNFLIPELVSDLHYKKGPYFADEGDFATAGAIRMGLLNEVERSATVGFGEDGYRRALLMGSPKVGAGTLLYAGELYHNDGPYKNPDDYQRSSGVLRYSQGTKQDNFTITGMAYHGEWNSTDQVPQHAIDQGLVDRFGTLAPTDGGTTSRASLSFNRVKQTDTDESQFSAYMIHYKLRLYSTFTYNLVCSPDSTDTGCASPNLKDDQMLQHDDRKVYGFKGSKTWFTQWNGMQMSNLVGVQSRVDDIADVGLDQTNNRGIVTHTQDARVRESNAGVFFENNLQWRNDVRTILGLREDYFDFDVTDKMLNTDGTMCVSDDPSSKVRTDALGCNTGSRRAQIFSPKLGIILGPWTKTTFYINVADGFHSNDARGITRDGTVESAATPLVRATSAEVGLRSIPVPQWEAEINVFTLKLGSELVFVGDAGATEASEATRRTGIELSNKYHFNDWLYANLDGAFAKGRFNKFVSDDLGCGDLVGTSHPCAPGFIDHGGRYIPNSPTNVIDLGITAQRPTGWFGSLTARHFGSSPLVEDNSAKSPAYTTLDGQVGYQEPKQWRATLDVFNLLDKKWDDIEYYYLTRLNGETNTTPDYVVHSGVPRTVRASMTYYF